MPSKTTGGKELPTSSTLDSPSVLSQLGTPPPHTLHDDISHTIGTASAIDDTCDDASTLFDTTVPLGELLDAHMAKAKETETTENYESPATPSSPIRSRILNLPDTPYVFDEEFTREFMAYDVADGLEGFIAILK